MDATMAVIDADGSGEVDRSEFGRWFLNQARCPREQAGPPYFVPTVGRGLTHRAVSWCIFQEAVDPEPEVVTSPFVLKYRRAVAIAEDIACTPERVHRFRVRLEAGIPQTPRPFRADNIAR